MSSTESTNATARSATRSKRRLRILVVGSFADEEERERFRNVGIELGKLLVQRGHAIIVGSDRDTSIDPHVVAGANSIPGEHTVAVIRPRERKKPYKVIRDSFENIAWEDQTVDGAWTVARIRQLLEADAVIAVGGSTGTLQAGFTGPVLATPVVAVSAFGGSGATLLERYARDYELTGVSSNDIEHLRERSSSGLPQSAVNIAERMVEKNPYVRRKPAAVMLGFVAVCVLIGLWIWLFVAPPLLGEVSLFLGVGVSALIGTALRAGLRAVEAKEQMFSVNDVLLEALVGILTAFSLTLIYLAAGVLLSGSEMDVQEGYRRAALTSSILALGAAFLLEESATKIRERLRGAVFRKAEV